MVVLNLKTQLVWSSEVPICEGSGSRLSSHLQYCVIRLEEVLRTVLGNVRSYLSVVTIPQNRKRIWNCLTSKQYICFFRCCP